MQKNKKIKEYSIEDYWKVVFGREFNDVIDEHNKCIYFNIPSRVQKAYDYVKERKSIHTSIYTSRVTYIWIIESLFLSAVAYFLKEGYAEIIVKYIIFLISICGIFTTYIWIETLNASKYCEENAEKHLMMLEEIIMGNIYKTFWIDPHKKQSISKLNFYICCMFIFIWSLILLCCSYNINCILFSIVFVFISMFCIFLYCKEKSRVQISEINTFKYISKNGESPLEKN